MALALAIPSNRAAVLTPLLIRVAVTLLDHISKDEQAIEIGLGEFQHALVYLLAQACSQGSPSPVRWSQSSRTTRASHFGFPSFMRTGAKFRARYGS